MEKLNVKFNEFRIGRVPGSILKDFQISVSRGQTTDGEVYFKLCAYIYGMRIKETETLVTEQVFKEKFQSHFNSFVLFYNALELIGFEKFDFGSLTTN